MRKMPSTNFFISLFFFSFFDFISTSFPQKRKKYHASLIVVKRALTIRVSEGDGEREGKEGEEAGGRDRRGRRGGR